MDNLVLYFPVRNYIISINFLFSAQQTELSSNQDFALFKRKKKWHAEWLLRISSFKSYILGFENEKVIAANCLDLRLKCNKEIQQIYLFMKLYFSDWIIPVEKIKNFAFYGKKGKNCPTQLIFNQFFFFFKCQ